MNSRKSIFIPSLVTALCIVFLFWFKSHLPFSFAYEPNEERCLPDFHLGLLVHKKPENIRDAEYVFFKPSGSLSYIKNDFVLKRVFGKPGDYLVISGDKIYINGILIAEGFPLKEYYPNINFEKREIIPEGKIYVGGTAAKSDDSRYWGYLDIAKVSGYAFKIY